MTTSLRAVATTATLWFFFALSRLRLPRFDGQEERSL